MPRWLAHLLIVVGWLLTPLLAWGASYFGLLVGALIGVQFRGPAAMLGVAVGIAFGCGFAMLVVWVWLMRRAPHWLAHRMAPRPSQEQQRVEPG